MPGVCVLQSHRPGIEYTDPGGGKHSLIVVFAKAGVDGGKNLRRGVFCQRIILDHGFRRHHKECGGGSLTGYISNKEADTVFVNREIVVEITAHLLGGIHTAPQIHFRMTVKLRCSRRQGV